MGARDGALSVRSSHAPAAGLVARNRAAAPAGSLVMALESWIRDRLTLPAVCAPMTLVSGPELVAEACKAGVIGALQPANAGSFEAFEAWMDQISQALKRHADSHPGARIAPLAINLSTTKSEAEVDADLALSIRHGVRIFISAMGNPTEIARKVHDAGGVLWHDVTTIRFAEKAIAGGVDGLTCIGAGGGGHSGTISHLALIPRIRAMFDGVIVMAGAVTTGAAIRAAEILGADLAYLGTRFIATKEALGPQEYKDLLVSETSDKLIYTNRVTGVPSNWFKQSLRSKGLDPDDLPIPAGPRAGHGHLPPQARPWKTIFSAGQGIDLIEDVPSVAELVRRLRQDYVAACQVPDMAAAARLADEAANAAE
jgi:nitronate monooxygenase